MIKMMIMMMMVIMGLKVWIMDRLRTDIEKKLHVCSARGDVNGVKDALRKRASIKVAARQGDLSSSSSRRWTSWLQCIMFNRTQSFESQIVYDPQDWQ